MFDIKISNDFLVDTDGTSDGTQLKFFKDGFWYKEDNEGREGVVEYLVSKLLTFSNLNAQDYLVYEYGKINGKSGCRSKTFINSEEAFVTLERMHSNVTGVPLFKKIKKYKQYGVGEAATYVINFFNDLIDLDLTEYFKKVFTLDYIVLNEDRHFHNLGIIMNADGSYRTAPIFDNGKSLLNCNLSVNRDLPIEENFNRVVARPFSGSHKAMKDYFGKGFELDLNKIFLWLNNEPDSYYKKVLLTRLQTVACEF
jgi:hypothetical protein